MNTLQITRRFTIAGLLLFHIASAIAAEPFFSIQLSDPQFGMFTNDKDFAQETANFEFAVAAVNRLKPAFVVIAGDHHESRFEPVDRSHGKFKVRGLLRKILVVREHPELRVAELNKEERFRC